MSLRPASLTAWTAWTIVVAMAVMQAALGGPFFAGVMTTFATVGALVAARRPRKPQGWALLASGFFGLLGETGGLYARAALAAEDGWWPGWEIGAFLYPLGWMVGNAILWMVFLVFPNGRLVSARWRWAMVTGAATLAAVVVLGVISWPLRGPSLLYEGLELPGSAGVFLPVPLALLYTTALASVASLIVRFRRSHGEERLQLKWLVFAVAVLVAGLLALAASGREPGADAPVAAMVLLVVGLTGLPVAMGIAILRYRLYEIDRVIHRTTVYAIVTAVLAGSYVGLVVVLQTLLRPVTEGSDLAVAASTLAVAAAFGPVRRRVQGVLDRRFNRRRYDAARTVEAFAAHLRDELDLEAVRDELGQVVAGAMAPRHVSVWLPR